MTDADDETRFITELTVPEGASFIGKPVGEIAELKRPAIAIQRLIRGNQDFVSDLAELPVEAGDRIVILANTAEVLTLHAEPGFEVLGVGAVETSKASTIVEAVWASSRRRGQNTLSALHLGRFGVQALALSRHPGHPLFEIEERMRKGGKSKHVAAHNGRGGICPPGLKFEWIMEGTIRDREVLQTVLPMIEAAHSTRFDIGSRIQKGAPERVQLNRSVCVGRFGTADAYELLHRIFGRDKAPMFAVNAGPSKMTERRQKFESHDDAVRDLVSTVGKAANAGKQTTELRFDGLPWKGFDEKQVRRIFQAFCTTFERGIVRAVATHCHQIIGTADEQTMQSRQLDLYLFPIAEEAPHLAVRLVRGFIPSCGERRNVPIIRHGKDSPREGRQPGGGARVQAHAPQPT